jgi:hypothetical protein
VQFLLEHALTRVVREPGRGGRVLGIEASHHGATVRIRARQGVVIATAGINGNVQLRRIYDPRLTEEYEATGEPWVELSGDGIIAAQEIGAQLAGDFGIDGHWLMPRVPTHTTTHTGIWGGPLGCRYAALHMHGPVEGSPIALLQNAVGLVVHDLQDLILVKHDARRFFDEETWDEGAFCDAALANGGGPVWAIFDAAGARREGWDVLEPPIVEAGYFFRGETLEELARNTVWKGASLPTGALEKTVATYNGYVDAGVDPDFQRPTPTHKIETGPFYAAWATPILHDPYGGLRVNEHSQVIDIYGEPIDGLYAGGEASGGAGRLGTSKAILTGRLAVKHILRSS